jgi:hypothetical protein
MFSLPERIYPIEFQYHMNICEHSANCRFYNNALLVMPENTEALIAEYCNGNSLRCARSMVFDSMSIESVTDDLMPGDKVTAYGILAGT